MPTEFEVSLVRPDSTTDFKLLAKQLYSINLAAKATRWGLAEFEALENQDSLSLCVLRNGQSVIGFSVFSASSIEAYLVNIAIAPEDQGQGLGQILLQFSLDIMSSKGCQECWLEVRDSNLQAQSFYSKLGFAFASKRQNFYQRPDEDGQSWVKEL